MNILERIETNNEGGEMRSALPHWAGQSLLKAFSTRTYISHGQVQHIVESVGSEFFFFFKICDKKLKEVITGLLIYPSDPTHTT